MAKRSTRDAKPTLAEVTKHLEALAPLRLAQTWDNVGLLAGDPAARIERALLCIDLTPVVVAEARREKAALVLAYHPPLFKPVGRFLANSNGTDAILFRCIEAGIAVYALHTALDAAEGGTNDVVASMCGIASPDPLEYVDVVGQSQAKLVAFVPDAALEKVADALFSAGAGRIGNYTNCSFRLTGTGTFLGGESTNPAVGARGRREIVEETRLEVVVPSAYLPAAIAALRQAHPYEEPAFDVYPLKAPPRLGIGRSGPLPRPLPLLQLARNLKRATQAQNVHVVGDATRPVERAVIVVGAGGDIALRAAQGPSDVVITGEMRHHDALAIQRLGASAIVLGHWSSERPVLHSLSKRLGERLPGLILRISATDAEPFSRV